METGVWRLAMDTPSAQAGLSSFQPSPTSRSYDICTSSPSTPRNVQRMFWVRCIVPTGLCVTGRMTCMASSAVDCRRRECPVYTRMSSSTRHKVSGPSGPDGDTDTDTLSLYVLNVLPPLSTPHTLFTCGPGQTRSMYTTDRASASSMIRRPDMHARHGQTRRAWRIAQESGVTPDSLGDQVRWRWPGTDICQSV